MDKPTGCEGDCVAVGELQLSVAVGLGGATNPLAGQSFIPYTIFPNVSYYGERFFLENFDVGFTLFDAPKHRMHAIIFTPGFDHKFFNQSSFTSLSIREVSPAEIQDLELPGGAGDTDYIEFGPEDYLRLKKRYASGFSGLEYSYSHEYFELRLQALKDIASVHYGSEFRLEFSLPLEFGKNTMLISAGLIEQSDRLIDYYYGLKPGEVSNRAFYYEAGSGLSSFVEMEWRRPINDRWEYLIDVRYRDSSSAITDSPLVVDDGVFTGFIGGVYHF